jgi:hypothetical protein
MTDSSYRRLRAAQDAIPKDAIWLSDAYEYLAEYMRKNPALLPSFPEERWSEALNKSTQDDVKANDGSHLRRNSKSGAKEEWPTC